MTSHSLLSLTMADANIFAMARGSFDVTTASVLLLGAVMLYYIMWPVKMNSKEPPMLRPRIPVIGHLLGLIRYSNEYGDVIARKFKAPGYTLPILGGKLYLFTSPGFTDAVFKNRALSFDPHIRDFVAGSTGIDRAGLDIYENQEFYAAWLKIVYGSMTGPELLKMNIRAVDNIALALNQAITRDVTTIDNFFDWIRTLMLVASSEALWGTKSPFRDPENVQHYWDFDDGLHLLIPSFIPSALKRKPLAARNGLQKAFADYYSAKDDCHDDVAPFTKERMALERKFGMSARSSGALEVGVAQGALFNTIMTTYWFYTYVLSNPETVDKLRQELAPFVEEDKSDTGAAPLFKFHIHRIEQNCPLLMSAFRETQRLAFLGTVNRKVMADTELSDGNTTYQLKEGAQLMIANWVLQKDDKEWGIDVDVFKADRFIGEDKANAHGFYPFGGGKHICPGRYFASGEILGAFAILLLGYDVTDSNGNPVTVPKGTVPPLTNGIGKPAAGSDLRVRITRRKGWEDARWNVVA
ncbi:phospholipid-translocating P-type ATPase [Paramyrothecium foliicola]|nr:phospholipid-translocating P-type ATPase [Paramyrothecium foliicola]